MDNLREILIKLSEEDDQKAFKIFFRNYYTRLVKFALLFVPFQDQAEDVISDVLIKLLKQRKKLFKLENFEGYLFLSVKNQAISHLRKQKHHYNLKSIDLETDSLFNENDPEKSFELTELSELIEETINSLSPRRQMIFKLVKEEGQKIKAVAALLNIAPKTVENHLDMAMKELRSTILNYLNDQSSQPSFMKMLKFVGLLMCFLFLF